jgi:hypothetical protein
MFGKSSSMCGDLKVLVQATYKDLTSGYIRISLE